MASRRSLGSRKRPFGGVSAHKLEKMLEHGEVRGRALTGAQRRGMGAELARKRKRLGGSRRKRA